jgi:hypothetical protein
MVDPMGPHLSDPCCSWQTPSSHHLQHEQLWDQAQGNASHIQIEFKWFPGIRGRYLFATSTGEGHSCLVQECYVINHQTEQNPESFENREGKKVSPFLEQKPASTRVFFRLQTSFLSKWEWFPPEIDQSKFILPSFCSLKWKSWPLCLVLWPVFTFLHQDVLIFVVVRRN